MKPAQEEGIFDIPKSDHKVLTEYNNIITREQIQFANWGFYPVAIGAEGYATITTPISGNVNAIYINYRQWSTSDEPCYIVYQVWNDRGSIMTPAGFVIAEENTPYTSYSKSAGVSSTFNFIYAKIIVNNTGSFGSNTNTYGEAYAVR